MLYSVVLGDLNIIRPEWNFVTDEYNCSYFECKELWQRIRVGLKATAKQFDVNYSNSNTIAYNLPKTSFISNSRRTMNLSLLRYASKNEADVLSHTDDSILFLTMMTKSYRLIDYSLLDADCNIVQTYSYFDKSSDKRWVGCAIRFPENMHREEMNYPIIRLSVMDNSTNRIETIEIVRENEAVKTNKVFTDDSPISKDVWKMFKKRSERNKDYTARFMAEYTPLMLPTAMYLVPKLEYEFSGYNSLTLTPKEYISQIEKLLANESEVEMNDSNKSFIDYDMINNTQDEFDSLLALLHDTKTKCFTVPKGFRFNKEQMKMLKNISYIFEFDPRYNSVRCIKSK